MVYYGIGSPFNPALSCPWQERLDVFHIHWLMATTMVEMSNVMDNEVLASNGVFHNSWKYREAACKV